jgi:hypothetical protein
MLSYTPLAILMLTTAVALLAVDVRRPSIVWVALAGGVLGLGITFKQDCATVLFLGLGAFVLVRARRHAGRWRPAFARVALFATGAAIPPTVAVLAFLPAGLVGEMLWQTIWFPLVAQPVWAPSLGGTTHHYIAFPPLWPPFEPSLAIRKVGFFSYFPSLVLDLYWKELWNHPLFVNTALPEILVRGAYVLPYLLLSALALHDLIGVALRRCAGVPAPHHVTHLRLLLVFGTALIVSFNRPRDWIHLMILYPPTLILLAAAIDRLAGDRRGLWRRCVFGIAGLGLATALVAAFTLAVAARGFYNHPVGGPRAGIRVNEDAAAAITPLLAALATPAGAAGTRLGSLPYNPAINFLLDRPLATRFLTVLPLEEFPDRQEQIIADLERDPRPELIYSLQHLASIERPQHYAPRLFTALVDRYALGEGPGMIFNGTRMDGLLFARLVPRPAAGAELVVYDFVEQLDEATVSEFGGTADSAPVSAAGDPRVQVTMWPFERPVLTMFTAVRPSTTRLAYAVDVPPRTRLRFGVAMDPDEWTHFLPTEIDFVVRIDGAPVFTQRLDPRRRFEDRRWVWADLAVDAGPRLVTLEASAENAYGIELNLAGWARPRLVADRSPITAQGTASHGRLSE